jgi:hypothetical protein
MKTRVIDTVNTLLQRSGQAFPVKNLSNGNNSVEVYDVEHWPDIFNALLLHDFPSIVFSFDASTASLSGFVVTLRWRQAIDCSECIGMVVHILVMFLCLCIVVRSIVLSLENISIEKIQRVQEMYMAGRNSSTGEGTSSLLTEHLRAAMAHNEL